MLPPRTEEILKSVVEEYIAKAVPVPSHSISDNYELGVSPATIRSEMAYLEQEGYITRPHHSAGSVPLDKGYRRYVESLNRMELPLAERRLISHLFYQIKAEQEEWLGLAVTLAARLVHNVAVVAMPKPKPVDCRFKHLELVDLKDSLALMVLVLLGARVKQQLITFDQAISQPGLTTMANRLNAAYTGLAGSQISAKDIVLSPAEKLLTEVLVKVMQTEDDLEYEKPYLEGLHFMLNQPEFSQGRRLLALMELVEHRSLLKAVIPPGLGSQGVQVIIGKENQAEAIHDYSVVISRYGLPQEAVGVIIVIGPTRMPYARTISTVGYMSAVLSELVAELYGQKPSPGFRPAGNN